MGWTRWKSESVKGKACDKRTLERLKTRRLFINNHHVSELWISPIDGNVLPSDFRRHHVAAVRLADFLQRCLGAGSG